MATLKMKMFKGKTVLKEEEVTDDIKKRFLVSLLLTDEWADDMEYLFVSSKDMTRKERFKLPDRALNFWHIADDHMHISDYLYTQGLLKTHPNSEMMYTVSVKGRKYLDAQARS